jgi:hypothetical protein
VRPVVVSNAAGTVCWDRHICASAGFNGPAGNDMIPVKELDGSRDILARERTPGALIQRNGQGRTWFSVNGHAGDAFKDNEGFFEFDVHVQ